MEKEGPIVVAPLSKGNSSVELPLTKTEATAVPTHLVLEQNVFNTTSLGF